MSTPADPSSAPEPSVERPYIRLHRDEVHRINHGRHVLGDALLVFLLDPRIRAAADWQAIRQAEDALMDHGGSHTRQALLAYRLRQAETAAAAMQEPAHRYRVLGTWGEVPASVKSLVGRDDAYLLYPEFRGELHYEELVDLRTGHANGGWYMRYAGRRVPPGPATQPAPQVVVDTVAASLEAPADLAVPPGVVDPSVGDPLVPVDEAAS